VAQHVKGENFYRGGKAVKRTKMLSQSSSGGAIRDKAGKIIQSGEYQSAEAPSGRVQPDRRWFGNTRVISQTALEHFRDALGTKQHDPFAVVLKQNKLPMSLLEESKKRSRPNLTGAEPFSDTFGPRAQRKRPRIEAGSFEELMSSSSRAKPAAADDLQAPAQAPVDGALDPAAEALADAPDAELGRDGAAEHDVYEQSNVAPDPVLAAGTSKRIWGELYKVIDSSDILLHVLDARDPIGTRCHSVEKYLAKEKRHKKVVYILNKVDLVPGWAAVRWALDLGCALCFVEAMCRLPRLRFAQDAGFDLRLLLPRRTTTVRMPASPRRSRGGESVTFVGD